MAAESAQCFDLPEEGRRQREQAFAMGRIADMLESQGELEEALRIRRTEQLPVYDRLGDDRNRAVTLEKIADIQAAQGRLDEAFAIYMTACLPAFDRLGERHDRAMTLGKIADVLAAWGDQEEALRIRRTEELPIYAERGDERSRAMTICKIADVLAARGSLDEALRLYEEALPLYERLGERHALLLDRANAALCYRQRNQGGDRQRAARLLRLACDEAAALLLPVAETLRGLLGSEG